MADIADVERCWAVSEIWELGNLPKSLPRTQDFAEIKVVKSTRPQVFRFLGEDT